MSGDEFGARVGGGAVLSASIWDVLTSSSHVAACLCWVGMKAARASTSTRIKGVCASARRSVPHRAAAASDQCSLFMLVEGEIIARPDARMHAAAKNML